MKRIFFLGIVVSICWIPLHSIDASAGVAGKVAKGTLAGAAAKAKGASAIGVLDAFTGGVSSTYSTGRNLVIISDKLNATGFGTYDDSEKDYKERIKKEKKEYKKGIIPRFLQRLD